ncbi:YkuS family protein [Halobacillus ihumii]|uniref:YkuS family protein n=1 Tax=Halobacillus ihumii TaxID=2686092 RepID=UPI0013D7EA86|nr:YkuS family protein [Halobacillus ihumii]
MKKVAIEENLSDIRAALQQKGYDLVTLQNSQDAEGCDCCVISGQDRDVMGIQNAATNGVVIDARGRTADDVCQEVDNCFSS